MTYKPYPKEKDTPSRKSRKSERSRVFIANRKTAKAARKQRKLLLSQNAAETEQE